MSRLTKSLDKYPRISGATQRKAWLLNPKAAPKCCICGAPATHSVRVEVSWFRGEDEAFHACNEHRRDAQQLLATGLGST